MLRVRALEWPPTLVEGMVRDVDAAGTDAELARSRAPAASGWAAELKWDGFRALVSVDARKAVLRSRRGTEMGPAFPEIVAGAAQLLGTTALDGVM